MYASLKIYLSKGYWQILMEEDSKELTAFGTLDGCYQFKRMPFGLVNLAAFSHMMSKMLHQDKNIEHYVDDVLVYRAVCTEHVATLRELFNRISKAWLAICPSKCCLGYSTLEFVGHTLGSDHIVMEEEKLDRIQDTPAPKTRKLVQFFLGLAGYYRKFYQTTQKWQPHEEGTAKQSNLGGTTAFYLPEAEGHAGKCASTQDA